MNKPITILLAEDEPSLGQIIKESLETRNFIVHHTKDGEEAYNAYKNNEFELLVLDIMMPKKDGFTLAKEIRVENENIPIIFLTSKSQAKDVVEGFTIGGNDYLKKPFSMEELIVRINNLLSRVQTKIENEILTLGEYTFDFPKQSLSFKQEPSVLLTHRESQLLFHLIKNKNKVLDRSLILKKLWDNDDFFSARSMDVFITKLRKKLSKDPSIKIVNARGVGYKLMD